LFVATEIRLAKSTWLDFGLSKISMKIVTYMFQFTVA